MSLSKIFLLVLALIMLFILFLLINTLRYPFKQTAVAKQQTLQPFYSEQAVERFTGGLQIPTVGAQDYAQTNFLPFAQFKQYLSSAYPRVYAQMEYSVINDYGLVLHWRGKNPALKPILFLSHYDIVPVLGHDPAQQLDDDYVASPGDSLSQTDWSHPPFSGFNDGGKIYGRGSLDMKGMLFAIMEAADLLIQEGFQPEQDIWLAFGQDEETGGTNGAIKIAEHFKNQGVFFDAVFDEGGIISERNSVINSIGRPLALVGVGEKGYLSLKIKVRGQGGHSSMPPAKTSLVYAAEIVEKLNKQQMPARIIKPIQSFLTNIGGEMDFFSKVAIANQWLLKPILIKSLEKDPASNALVRTTTAVTMMKGSDAPNVIASEAEIVVNYRLLPGDTVQAVREHVAQICTGYDVSIETTLNPREASAITAENTKGFNKITEIMTKLQPDVIVTSYITIGGTDAYKYQSVSDNIYRFMPVLLTQEEQRTIHNENEHISVENYGQMITFFKEMMRTYQD